MHKLLNGHGYFLCFIRKNRYKHVHLDFTQNDINFDNFKQKPLLGLILRHRYYTSEIKYYSGDMISMSSFYLQKSGIYRRRWKKLKVKQQNNIKG